MKNTGTGSRRASTAACKATRPTTLHYEKIGTVDDLFVDDAKYVGVKTGLLGTRPALIPIELVRVNDKRKLLRRRRRSEGTRVKRRIVFEF